MLAMWLNPMMRCQFLFYLTYQPPLAKVIIPFSLKYTMLFSSLIAPLVRIRLPCERPGFNPWVGKIPWRRERLPTPVLGFPCVSAGKESAFNAGDPGSIPGLGRSPGEGKGYPLQSWVSLVSQLVKNLPSMQETPVRSLGWEDPLETGKATYSSILAWGIPWTL